MVGLSLLRHAGPSLVGVCLATTVALCISAQAQTYPGKPIRLIVPWPAGGGVDTAARIISQPLSERLGQPIVIENKPGAGGNIGTAMVAQEKADGYTLLMGSAAPHGINPHLYSRLGFEPINDFAFVGHVYKRAEFPRRAGELSLQDGPGPRRRRQGRSRQAQFRLRRGRLVATSVRRDVHGGDRDRRRPRRLQGHEPAGDCAGGRPGRLRARPAHLPALHPIRQDARARSRLEDAQSARAGRPEPSTSRASPACTPPPITGILAPAKTPPEIVARLNKEINAVLQTEETKSRIAKMAAEAGKGTPEEFKAFAISELERYAIVVKQSGAGKVD